MKNSLYYAVVNNPQTFRWFRAKGLASVRRQEEVGEFECTMRGAEGRAFPAEHRLSPIHDDHGRVIQWVSIVRDISSRKQFEQDLRSVSRRIIAAQEGERLRVARELHDGVNQILASVRMRLRKLGQDESGLSPLSRELLARSSDLLATALEENRRIAHNLRPSELDTLGFTAACRHCCQEFQARTHLALRVRVDRSNRRLPADVELNLFRIIQEALANVEKHAGAQTVRLTLGIRKDVARLVIRDDGCGFELRNSVGNKGHRAGIGLLSIKERAASLGGTCEFNSGRGRGTSISVLVPLESRSRKNGTWR